MLLMQRASHITASSPIEDWAEFAACRGKTNLFFRHTCTLKCQQMPGCKRLKSVRICVKICEGCPVLAQCRVWGVEHLNMGISGAMTEHERFLLADALEIQPIEEPPWF